jgi:uncharacterized protein YrrD
MPLNVKQVQEYTIQATDGGTGKVDELYFEENTWTVRYLVVDVGSWLSSEQVLLSPAAIEDISSKEKTLSVAFTREQVKNSPGVNTHKPISREREIALHKHYEWEPYWQLDPATTMAASGAYPVRPDTARPAKIERRTEKEARAIDASIEESAGETKLRSSDEVSGYDIRASDGEIGHVQDFVVDTGEWTIRYLLVDTRDWLAGRKVLVSPAWVTNIYWTDSELYVDLTQEEIKSSPEYDAGKLVTRQYEAELHEHYQKTKYWQR